MLGATYTLFSATGLTFKGKIHFIVALPGNRLVLCRMVGIGEGKTGAERWKGFFYHSTFQTIK